MFKKRFFLIILVFLFSFIACSSKKNAEDVKKIKIAVTGNENHQSTIMASLFKEKLEEKIPGKINVEIYPNSVLGGEREAVEGVKLGTIQMTVVTMDGAVPAWVSDTQIMSIPYLFTSKEKAYNALDTVIYDYLAPKFSENGFKYLGAGELGFRHFTNNLREIKTPNDMKGMSIRVQEAPIWFALMKKLGASATPVSFNELYTALQQGMVDGQENPIASIYTSKFNEVQKYLSLDGHTYAAVSLLMNKDFFDSLDDEIKNAIEEAAKEAIPEQRKIISEKEAEYLQNLKDSGMIITEVDKDSFIEATKDIYLLPEVQKIVNPDFVKSVKETLD